ncbi:DUF1947 domain-containing protein [Candidatus Woesearchaeota archaeon]|nr:DUF1947 domain-containing protein [Candidatus Woesearchaeota archaeon]
MRLSNSEIKEINDIISKSYNLENFISKNDKVEINEDIILINDEKLLFKHENNILPTLRLLMKTPLLSGLPNSENFAKMQNSLQFKKITVDMGAIPFVIKGADIMRPGITNIEQGIKKDEFIIIIDAQHKKNLAIGRTLFSGEEIQSMTKGRVIKNIHYVGDIIWK